jgi:hypothetical protein
MDNTTQVTGKQYNHINKITIIKHSIGGENNFSGIIREQLDIKYIEKSLKHFFWVYRYKEVRTRTARKTLTKYNRDLCVPSCDCF